MGKPAIDPVSVIVEPPQNFSRGKYSLENAWPSKWISPEAAGDALSPGLAETLQGLDGLLLPAVQQAEGGPLLIKFVEPPSAEDLDRLEGVSQLEPPGAGENGPPLMLKIEGVEGDSPGAWGGLSDLIEDPGPILEGPPKGAGPGEVNKLGDIFIKFDDAIEEELVSGDWANLLGTLGNLDPDGLLLPAINGQDSLLFVKVEITEQQLSKLEESFEGDLQILQAGKSGIIGFTDDLNIKWSPGDDFELKLEDGGGEPDLILG